MSIRDVFDKHARQYDATRQQLIPCFDDFYGVALDVIPYGRERELRVLDLGAGTGLFSEMIASRYPRAELTLTDISSEMLRLAEERFKGEDQARVYFQVMNYAERPIIGTYDLIISALSIHHLEHTAKAMLYRNIFSALEPGGIFVNADQVLGENVVAEKIFQRTWLRQVQERVNDDNVVQAALERMKEDRMAPLSHQLTWLREAGFSEVTTWYQYYSFVVFSGTKAF